MVCVFTTILLAAALAALPSFAAPVALDLATRDSQGVYARTTHDLQSFQEVARDFDQFDMEVRNDDGKSGKEKLKRVVKNNIRVNRARKSTENVNINSSSNNNVNVGKSKSDKTIHMSSSSNNNNNIGKNKSDKATHSSMISNVINAFKSHRKSKK